MLEASIGGGQGYVNETIVLAVGRRLGVAAAEEDQPRVVVPDCR